MPVGDGAGNRSTRAAGDEPRQRATELPRSDDPGSAVDGWKGFCEVVFGAVAVDPDSELVQMLRGRPGGDRHVGITVLAGEFDAWWVGEQHVTSRWVEFFQVGDRPVQRAPRLSSRR